MFFVPWILVWAWILPLPDTVQEQANEAIGHGFDGIIVFVDEAGKPPAFYSAGWHDRKNKIPADPHALFKIASISEHGMIATAEDVGIFLRALNDGSLFDEGEQEIYSSIYVYEHTGWVPGYQSIAKYHEDIDTVVIQFMNTTRGYNWNTGEIVYSRIVKILRREKSS